MIKPGSSRPSDLSISKSESKDSSTKKQKKKRPIDRNLSVPGIEMSSRSRLDDIRSRIAERHTRSVVDGDQIDPDHFPSVLEQDSRESIPFDDNVEDRPTEENKELDLRPENILFASPTIHKKKGKSGLALREV